MPHNKSIQGQLSQIRGKIKVARPDGIKDPSPSPMAWVEDGQDHINIWEQAQTELGKFLAHNSQNPFKHTLFGKFNNMEAFWHYIQSEERDDRIRVMSGRTLKNFSKKLTMTRITNFRAIIMDSNWQRIKQHKSAVHSLKNSTLPFDCYYINSESLIRVRPTFFKWLIKGFEEIRTAVKENRDPNFAFLLDKRDSDIYTFVLPSKPAIKEDVGIKLLDFLEQSSVTADSTLPLIDSITEDVALSDEEIVSANLTGIKDVQTLNKLAEGVTETLDQINTLVAATDIAEEELSDEHDFSKERVELV